MRWLALLAALLAAPAFAQAQGAGQPLLRGSLPPPQSELSGPVDEAFAAYQQGRFLTAYHLATTRAETGDVSAMTLLGELHLRGLGVRLDPARAANWYRLAAARGDREARAQLALLLVRGEGVERDQAEALRLFEQAAAEGHVQAATDAAMIHLAADPPNHASAARLLARASESGAPDALYALAQLTRAGQGVPEDQRRATALLREAAERGLVEAQVDYAIRVGRGEGAERDDAEAARWFRAAADAGNAIAQNRLARLIFAGRGVGRDPAEGAKWHLLARERGLADAQLDAELLLLTRAEQQEGERRAEIWRQRREP
jgi:TPR repeat protein